MVRTTRRKTNGAGTPLASEPGEPAQAGESTEAGTNGENMMVAYLAEEALCENADGLHDWINLSDPATAEDGSTVQTGFSLAEAWISEPEWNGESSEAASEIGEGSREPECTARESCPR